MIVIGGGSIGTALVQTQPSRSLRFVLNIIAYDIFYQYSPCLDLSKLSLSL